MSLQIIIQNLNSLFMTISIDSVSYAVPEKELFSGVSFSIRQGEKIGVVGANGSGKSTLLKIIEGSIDPDEGRVITGSGLRLVYIPQSTIFADDISIYEYMLKRCLIAGITEQQASKSIHQTAFSLGITDLNLKIERLSGGWQKRIALAAGIACEPDYLLLDEPTNHLDIEGIVAVEQYLKQCSHSWIAVSHDRLLLENCPDAIIGIDPVFEGNVARIEGAYSDYQEARDVAAHQLSRLQSTLKNQVRREKEWLARSPSARTTKSRARIDSAYALMEKLHHVKRKTQEQKEDLSLSDSGRRTAELITAHNIGKAYDSARLFSGLTFTLKRGMALGILGPNGCGKSTLLRILAGLEKPTEGTVKQAGHLAINFFDQLRESLDLTLPLRRALAPESDTVVVQGREYHIVTWAKRFGFAPEQLSTAVSQLSGGEQARVLLATLVRQPGDLLILDEPTNDLDIPTLEMLESQLITFKGAMVLISHDRYFLSRVCSHFLGFTRDGQIKPFASYEQWETTVLKEKNRDQERPSSENQKIRSEKAARLTFREKFDLDNMEETIHRAEEEVLIIENRINSLQQSGEHEKTADLFIELAEAQKKVSDLFTRWEHLEEKRQSMEK